MPTASKKRTPDKPAQFSETVLGPQQTEKLDSLLSGICKQAFKHEVQHWLDAKGTDEEKLRRVLDLAREALCLLRRPEEYR